MSEARAKHGEESKKSAVELSRASPQSIRQVADDLRTSKNRLYAWQKKYTAEGDKTKWATLEDEMKALRLENAGLKMEQDMSKRVRHRITLPAGEQVWQVIPEST